MIVFLLLVIIAILLMGSSAFIGAVGMILGVIAAILAVFFGVYWASTAFGIDTGDLLMYLCLGALPIIGICSLWT